MQRGAAAAEQQQGGSGSGSLVSQEGQQRGLLPWRPPRVVDVTPPASGSASLGSADEPPSWAKALARHPATTRLLSFRAQVANPPIMAILAGAALGYSPLGRALLASADGGAAAALALPPELGLVHGVARAALEVRCACCAVPAERSARALSQPQAAARGSQGLGTTTRPTARR